MLAALVLLTLAIAATLAVVGFALVRDDGGDGRPGARVTPTATVEPTVATTDPARSVPSDPRVLFIGDDWSAGVGAGKPNGGFAQRTARLLGWDARVDAVPGSGWAHRAPGVPGSMFLDRVIRMPSGATLWDIVVVSAQMSSPAGPEEIRLLMRQTVSVLLDRAPDSVVVVVLPYDDARALGWCEPLESERVLCIDPRGEQWLPEADRAAYLTDERVPTSAGHARFAELLAAALRRELTIR